MEVVKQQKALNRTVSAIKKGEVVICPTDTVYGFLADALNKKAVEKIFKIKKRARQKPLPVFIKDIKMAKELAEINEKQEKILKKYWPGKYTFILKRKELRDVGDHTILWGVDKKTIALRIPKYKFLNDLLKKINKPLVQTSVNISGQASLTKIDDIIKQFGRTGIPTLIIIGVDFKKSKPSKVLDLTSDKIKVLRK